MSVQKLRNIFNDIFDMLDNNISIHDIIDKYEDMSKSMLQFIKIKSKIYFTCLFDLLGVYIKDDTTKNDIIKIFDGFSSIYVDFNKSLQNYIIDILCIQLEIIQTKKYNLETDKLKHEPEIEAEIKIIPQILDEQ